MEQHREEKMIDWSGLPELVLSIVADKLNHITEFTRFGAVCTSWHTIYKDSQEDTLRDILRDPLLLMLPDVNDKEGHLRILYSLNKKRVYINFHLSVPHDHFCVGSSHGWLAIVSKDCQLRLLNPFILVNNEIKLPPLPELIHKGDTGYDINYVNKVVPSGDPMSNPNYAVMAIHGGCNTLSFYKAGDKEWTYSGSRIHDVIYSDSDQRFYAFRYDTGEIFAYDLNGHSSIETPKQDESHYARYLVKSGSDILCVTRDYEYELKPGITMDDFENDMLDFDQSSVH